MPARGRLISLCGLSFSGKSTFAGRLAARLGALVVSYDEINARRGLMGGEGVPDGEWAATHRQALAEIAEAMAAGVPCIVVDDTRCFRFLRDDDRRLAARHGYAAELVVLAVPDAVLAERRRRNDGDPGRPPIRDEIFAEHARSFEQPGDDEPHLVVPHDADLDAWIERYLRAR